MTRTWRRTRSCQGAGDWGRRWWGWRTSRCLSYPTQTHPTLMAMGCRERFCLNSQKCYFWYIWFVGEPQKLSRWAATMVCRGLSASEIVLVPAGLAGDDNIITCNVCKTCMERSLNSKIFLEWAWCPRGRLQAHVQAIQALSTAGEGTAGPIFLSTKDWLVI